MGFNELYFRTHSHYVDYNRKYPLPYVRTGDIEPYDPSRDASDILLMAGASANHAVTLLSCLLLLGSFQIHRFYSLIMEWLILTYAG